ncbi:MAG: hypothetical protein GKR95_06425 [Gammaproteobacteria bacterium]|nr:hypothetical protein [Gammaproteobacteria bacterium]
MICARYIEGWYELNAEKLVSASAPDFIFDDPAEPGPVSRDELPAYMGRWDRRTQLVGSTNKWTLRDEVRQDKDGVLTDWEWWELDGTDLCGMAMVKTRDNGVFLERMTYFDRRNRPSLSES